MPGELQGKRVEQERRKVNWNELLPQQHCKVPRFCKDFIMSTKFDKDI